MLQFGTIRENSEGTVLANREQCGRGWVNGFPGSIWKAGYQASSRRIPPHKVPFVVWCCWCYQPVGRFSHLSRCFSGRALGPFAFSALRCGWCPCVRSWAFRWLALELYNRASFGARKIWFGGGSHQHFSYTSRHFSHQTWAATMSSWGKNMKSKICWGTSFVPCRDLQATFRPLVRRHASLDGRSQRFGHL